MSPVLRKERAGWCGARGLAGRGQGQPRHGEDTSQKVVEGVCAQLGLEWQWPGGDSLPSVTSSLVAVTVLPSLGLPFLPLADLMAVDSPWSSFFL